MATFTFNDFLKFIGALLLSVGGTSVVIIAVGKWFGDFLSHRLLASYKNNHENELEGLKSKYSLALESSKAELDKAKTIFLRYSEKQFDLYNELWKVLLYTKNQADALWEKATPEKIPSFSEQIKLMNDAVNDSMILIEEEHYNKLNILVKEFESFKFGKSSLIELRGLEADEIRLKGILAADVQTTIDDNRLVKKRYDDLILEIGRSFRNQIKG
jgi:hypothetical protein